MKRLLDVARTVAFDTRISNEHERFTYASVARMVDFNRIYAIFTRFICLAELSFLEECLSVNWYHENWYPRDLFVLPHEILLSHELYYSFIEVLLTRFCEKQVDCPFVACFVTTSSPFFVTISSFSWKPLFSLFWRIVEGFSPFCPRMIPLMGSYWDSLGHMSCCTREAT